MATADLFSQPTMTAQEFIGKWRGTRFGERQASQAWFLDLLRVVGHPDPATFNDPDKFTFEKPVLGGFADAYLEGKFVWEFKRDERQLGTGFDQLLRYQVYLKTPPLLVVSSFQTIRIQTNFRGKETQTHQIPIVQLGDPVQLRKLQDVFFDPGALEPQRTVEEVTQETALLFGRIVQAMERSNGSVDSERLARYLNQVVFCLYAEDAGLLPEGVFTAMIARYGNRPSMFNRAVSSLFGEMADGGLFGLEEILHFNGDLFNQTDTVELSASALQILSEDSDKNWSDIEPSIFGTLFEGALDASKRAQLGAHYTGADDIMLVIEPVIMRPLRLEWEATQLAALEMIDMGARDDALKLVQSFRGQLASVRVLDPACGSGNFLYVALRSLLDLEREVIDFTIRQNWQATQPTVKPDQMLGIEISPYAAELARTALWIGYIQWNQANGFGYTPRPILTPLSNIQQVDAILAYDADGNPTEPEWPDADFIVGNPPFLGHFPFREQLGDDYVNAVYELYGERIPNSSDICCYWFEKARAQIEAGKSKRAGLLATQSIRSEYSRSVLERIKDSGDIFHVVSDKEWRSGDYGTASVHISIICFDDGTEASRALDGAYTIDINANLTKGPDLTQAKRLKENAGISFIGIIRVGPFEITHEVAEDMLAQPNVHGKPNSDVIKRWMIGRDINQTNRDMWIIDFGVDMSEEDAALYEAPFEHVLANVKPTRINNRMRRRAELWWLHGSPAPRMREALAGLPRYIGTSLTSQHRMFKFIDGDVLPDATVTVFGRDDYYFFGIMQSRVHTLWAEGVGTQLEDRPRYTPTTCFETFPFPTPEDGQREAIATAAGRLNELRENWLNPKDMLGAPVLSDNQLRKRTLTNLYNQNPTWLQDAHAKLDAAVIDAYGWPQDLTEEELLDRLLALNLERAETEENGNTTENDSQE